MLTISQVIPDSIAEEYGFEVGDKIISINSTPCRDVIDYVYYEADSQMSMVVETVQGEEVEVDISKEPWESLGLQFEEKICPTHCHNKCVFCFVDQLPEGMRDSLYLKDDDYRTSFLHGSYVTMTNVTEEDISRIIDMRLSPLYVSVHAYDDEIRRFIVKNPRTLSLIDNMRRLSEAGIKMHTQVVLVEGLNDAEVLRETIHGLYEIEGVLSLAVVPVGITGHRQGLYPITPISSKCASECIDLTESFEGRRDGERFCYCSDEMYLRADRPLPPPEFYGAYSQLENGVGLVTSFRQELDDSLPKVLAGRYSVITGVSATPLMRETIDTLQSLNPDLHLRLHTIYNDYFGRTITVAGLITGRDVIAQLKDSQYYQDLLIPSVMLRDGGDMFLDGTRVRDIERELGVRVHVCDGAYELIKVLEKV